MKTAPAIAGGAVFAAATRVVGLQPRFVMALRWWGAPSKRMKGLGIAEHKYRRRTWLRTREEEEKKEEAQSKESCQ